MESSSDIAASSLSPRMRVKEAIRRRVRDGRLQRGDLLPTEHALCEELAVSRGTVRAALKELEDDGLLEPQAGNGRLRGRTVAAAMTAGIGLMADTIVVVTHVPDLDRTHEDRGGLGAIDTSLAAAARQASRHLMVLHGDALNARDLARLSMDPPLGVAVGGAVADYAAGRKELLKLVSRVPLVVNSGDDLWAGCDRVVSDHAQGAWELTRWALSQGRRNILCIWSRPFDHHWIRVRMQGYERAMREAGLEPLPPVVYNRLEEEIGHGAAGFEKRARELVGHLVDRLVPSPQIDCLLAPSDQEARVAAAACRLCSVKVHEQVMVLGYDHVQFCDEERFEPVGPAATVDKQNEALGREMTKLLLRRVRGEVSDEHQTIVLAPTLVPRLP